MQKWPWEIYGNTYNRHEIIESPGIFAMDESDIMVSSLIKLWHVFLIGFEPANCDTCF